MVVWDREGGAEHPGPPPVVCANMLLLSLFSWPVKNQPCQLHLGYLHVINQIHLFQPCPEFWSPLALAFSSTHVARVTELSFISRSVSII